MIDIDSINGASVTMRDCPGICSIEAAEVIRMNGASHKGNERVPQGHANPAPGESVERKGITPADVLRTFPGAKVVKKSVEQQFQLLRSKGS